MIMNLLEQQPLGKDDEETNDADMAEFATSFTDENLIEFDEDISEFLAEDVGSSLTGSDQAPIDEDLNDFDLEVLDELGEDLSEFDEESDDDVMARFADPGTHEDLAKSDIEDVGELDQDFGTFNEESDAATAETTQPAEEPYLRNFDNEDNDEILTRLAQAQTDDEALTIEANMLEEPDQKLLANSAEEIR